MTRNDQLRLRRTAGTTRRKVLRPGLSALSGVAATATGLAALPDAQLVALADQAATVDLTVDGQPTMRTSPFGPVLDEHTLPAQPVDLIAAGRAHTADLLVGSNTDEANLYLVPTGRAQQATAVDITAAARRLQVPVAVLTARYRRVDPQMTDSALLQRITTDGMFGDGTRRLADTHARAGRGRTYAYQFRWRSKAFDGQLGACHCLELPLVFQTTDLPELTGPQALLGPTGPPAKLVARVTRAWTGFVRDGTPGWAKHTLTAPSTAQLS